MKPLKKLTLHIVLIMLVLIVIVLMMGVLLNLADQILGVLKTDQSRIILTNTIDNSLFLQFIDEHRGCGRAVRFFGDFEIFRGHVLIFLLKLLAILLGSHNYIAITDVPQPFIIPFFRSHIFELF